MPPVAELILGGDGSIFSHHGWEDNSVHSYILTGDDLERLARWAKAVQ